MQRWRNLSVLSLFLVPFLGATQSAVSPTRIMQAPPTPPAILTNSAPFFSIRGPTSGSIYAIGNPTDEEQLYLEYINRARANPSAEGAIFANTTDADVLSAYDFFNVDLNLMQSQFNAIPVRPPLSMNAKLTTAARLHSGDMYTNQFQDHTGSNLSDLGQRATAQGYAFLNLGENIYSYADSVFHGHAGFDVDWGMGGVGGMQTPPGHRNSIHSSSFREVGIGVVLGSNGTVGPQLVTQDFGTQPGATPFITGVAYYDLNANNFYDVGEGLGGITVTVTNANYYAVTTNSGGYSVPVAGNGNYTVTFSGSGLASQQTAITVSGGNNVKVDFRPAYTPPIINGPANVSLGSSANYSFSPVGGAISYLWKETRSVPYLVIDGAENGMGNMTASTSPGYPVIATDVKASGSASYHLAHPTPPEDQFLSLNRPLRATSSSGLSFSSRLATASSSEVAHVQISTDGGNSWQDVWTRSGTGGSGQTSFAPVNVSLAAFAGLEFRLRFLYEFTGGSYYPYPQPVPVGWYIDNVGFSNVEETLATVTRSVSNTNFVFTPSETGTSTLETAAQMYGRTLPFGPSLRVNVTPPSAQVRITFIQMQLTGQAKIDFEVVSGTPSGFQVESTPNLAAGWGVDAAATLLTIDPGSRYQVLTTPSLTAQRFYRIRVLP